MQITRNSLSTAAGPEDWFTGRRLHGYRRRALRRIPRPCEQRPLHTGRAHRVAHAPERPDDLGHWRASASASGAAGRSR